MNLSFTLCLLFCNPQVELWMQSENAADLARLFFIVAGKLWRIQQTSNINNLTCLRFIEMVVTRMVAFKLGREPWQKWEMAESFRENAKRSGSSNFCNKHQSLLHFEKELIEKKLSLIKAATKATTHKIKISRTQHSITFTHSLSKNYKLNKHASPCF